MAFPIGLFLFALLARVLAGSAYPDPAYPDSYYYVNVARELAAGHGFTVDYIWNFVDVGGRLPATAVLPIPSNAHWMPLAALIQVPFIWVLGETSLASALPFWIIGALAAPLTWAIARDAGLPRYQQIAGGAMVAVPGAAAPYLAQPDNFSLFITLGALSLWCCSRGLRGDRRAFVLGGACVGLATLSRNDGILLGVPFALAFLVDLVRRRPALRIGWRAAIACAGAFVIVTGPWWLRQLDVFGSLSPSGSSGRILWISDYRELYSVGGDPPTLSTFLAQGFGPILASRIGGLVSALVIFAALPLLFFLVPFTLIGSWLKRRDPAFAPWLIYAACLFAFSGLLFAVHVPYGTFLHSAVALIPHAYLAALVGIAALVRRVAARRPGWDAPRASRVFAATAVVVVLVGAVVGSAITSRGWSAERDTHAAMTAPLADTPAGRLMSPDAGAFRYLAGRAGIVTPDDSLDVVLAAATAYDIRWLVIERAHATWWLLPILDGTLLPWWLSEPVARYPADRSRPALAALYAVCALPAPATCRS